MLAKRGDPVGKAFAGSLNAAHDEEISLVGNFKSPNFGRVRLFIAAMESRVSGWTAEPPESYIANAALGRTRSKRHVFSHGMVALSALDQPYASSWLENVLERSRFDFRHENIDGVDVHVAGEIRAEDVLNNVPSNQGWVRLMFKHGPIVGIDLQSLKATKERRAHSTTLLFQCYHLY